MYATVPICDPVDGQLQRVGELRQPEVENLDAVVGDHQVARLDVAMHHALRVRLCQTF